MSLHLIGQFPKYRPRRLRQSPILRRLVSETQLDAGRLVLPLFVRSGRKVRRAISAMPGVFQLSNGKLQVEVCRGLITSLIDLTAAREVIAKDRKGNQLVVFDDKPLYWQAWDVEVYHLDSRKELSSGETTIAENGPHRVSVVTETKINDKSWVKTTISLSACMDDDELSYVEMESEVEWRETMKFLKVEFPVDIVNTEASYETQYGLIKRPTHYNTR